MSLETLTQFERSENYVPMLNESSLKAQMNFRAMDAVFPIREKSVNRIESFSESSPKEADEFRSIDAVQFTCWFFKFLVELIKNLLARNGNS